MTSFRTAIALCLALSIVSPPQAFAISIPDEQKLGKEYMEIIENQGLIIHDPVVTKMISTVGQHIIAGLPPQPFHFDFNMINDESFNAFASPAANIFIHRGLIASLDTMDEFAGIMAHEVAHAASRHVSESIDRAKLVTMGSLAGMLAGVLVGAAGGGGEAAQALTLGTAAAGQSAMLSFTRENETEADQKAVLFMAKTGYDPRGLLSALNKIRQSDYQGVEGIPDYFKTHPGTGSRIAHLASILEDYTPPADKPAPPPNYDFQMVKYRVIGLYAAPDTQMEKLALMLEKNPDNRALNYGLGILYGRTSRLDDARALLNKALSQDPFDPMVLLELGRLNIRSGDYDSAISVLEGVTRDEVMGDLGVYYRSVAQIETGRLTAAEAGLQSLLAKNNPGFEKANYHMANIMAKRQDTPMSSYYLGVYYADTGNLKNAVLHLKRAIDTLEDEKLKEKAEKKLKTLEEKKKKRKGRR
ncbi:MAG: M48 family metalloprotease [Desulfobacter sp.]|nr:MAG: M48 family metalloprotease [Desulfobacter sp.]